MVEASIPPDLLEGWAERHLAAHPDRSSVRALVIADLFQFLVDAGYGAGALAPEPEACGRLLVGRGGDTWDPLCTQPFGHDGLCAP